MPARIPIDEKTKLYDHLLQVLSRFSLSQLQSLVVEKISDFEWEYLLRELQENRMPLTKRNMSKLLVSKIKEQHFPLHKMQCLLHKYMLLDMSIHSTKTTWQACRLEGSPSDEVLPKQKLVDRIKEVCRENASTHVEVTELRKNSLYWLMIRLQKPVPKKVKRITKGSEESSKYYAPFYMAACFNEPYLFVPHKRRLLTENIFKCVATSLGYDTCKLMTFTGPNITELLHSLRQSQGRAAGLARIANQPFVTGPPELLPGGGLDFTQSKARERYVNEHFGEKPPLKPSITFHTCNDFQSHQLRELDDIEFPVSVTVSSAEGDAWGAVKRLVTEEVISFPPPAFYHQAMLFNRDVIKLRPNH
ncbi:hypothetical protein B566_EDAN002108 [Ephemera danica]|nr:hypothetical protein B566_EDAN002108 [Ephemera danica]